MDSPIIFAEDLPGSTLHDRVVHGKLVRLARGIYSPNVAADPFEVVRRSWREIVGRRFPGTVVTDRSAIWAQPHDGYLFVSSARQATLALPGLTVVSRKGPGPMEADVGIGGGVHLASRPRALLDKHPAHPQPRWATVGHVVSRRASRLGRPSLRRRRRWAGEHLSRAGRDPGRHLGSVTRPH